MDDSVETATINRIYWRIIPLFFAMMFLNYLDRINIGFAALRMNQDLGCAFRGIVSTDFTAS